MKPGQRKLVLSTTVVLAVFAALFFLGPWSPRNASPHLTEESFQRSLPDWSWVKSGWTADEKPFQQVMASIEKSGLQGRIKDGEPPESVLQSLKNEVMNHPGDAVRVFSLAHGTYWISKAANRGEMGSLWPQAFNIMHHQQVPGDYAGEEPWQTMAARGQLPSPPHSYNFDRLMFIAAVKSNLYGPESTAELDALAERLQSRRPKDPEVQLLQIYMLGNTKTDSGDTTWSRRAVSCAERMVRQHPKDPEMLLGLARAHAYAWPIFGPSKEVDFAIATYRQYLAKVPQNHPKHKLIVGEINRLLGAKAKYGKFKTRAEWQASVQGAKQG